jgi:hypothetical protein
MQTIQKELRKAFNELAAELGVPYKLIEDIYFNQFAFIIKCMEAGEKNKAETFHNVLLRNLGTFYSNAKHINKLKEITCAERDTE